MKLGELILKLSKLNSDLDVIVEYDTHFFHVTDAEEKIYYCDENKVYAWDKYHVSEPFELKNVILLRYTQDIEWGLEI